MNTIKLCGDTECRATVPADASYCAACGGTRFIHPIKVVTRDVMPRRTKRAKPLKPDEAALAGEACAVFEQLAKAQGWIFVDSGKPKTKT